MARVAVDETVAFLHARGIRVRPVQLQRMVLEALAQLQVAHYPSDPRSALTVQEVEALERGGLDLSPADPGTEDPLARTVTLYTALLQDSLSTAEAAARLGVDSSRVRQRLNAKPATLFGIRLSDGSWRIPRFQFEGDRLLPGLGEVIASLDPDLHPVAVYRWFTSPHVDLLVDDANAPVELIGQRLSPRDWLRHGLGPRRLAELASHL